MLAGLAAVSYAVSLGLVVLLARPGRWLFALLWAILVWLPLYILAALAVVERWRRRKLASFDRAIRELRRETLRRRDALDRLSWEIRDLERNAQRPAVEPRSDGAGDLRARVEAWERTGSLARVRSLKVAEWRAEVEGLDEAGLRERLRQLASALATADPERREQVEVQLALARLAAGTGVQPSPSGGEDELERARRRRTDEERELDRVTSELEQWQRDRAAFVRRRIPLD